jgi:predicted SprT family Zn-dependent metalloprotease
MDLQIARNIAFNLAYRHRLHGWQIRWNKSKLDFGACYCHEKIIEFSSTLTELNAEWVFRDVVLHEIAHALTFIENPEETEHHGPMWAKKCVEIGCLPIPHCNEAVIFPPHSYETRCDNCNARTSRNYRPRRIDLSKRRCKGCKSSLTERRIA